MANAGIDLGWGSVHGCSFYAGAEDTCGGGVAADSVAIDSYGFMPVIEDCSFDDTKVVLRNGTKLVNNKMTRSTAFVDSGSFGMAISGNTFIGDINGREADVRFKRFSAGGLLSISNNTFDENAAILFNWELSLENVTISENMMRASKGIVMESPIGVQSVWFSLEDCNIQNNTIQGGTWPANAHGQILLGEYNSSSYSRAQSVTISGNVIWTYHGASPGIGVVSDYTYAGGALFITDNDVNSPGGKGIEVLGDWWGLQYYGHVHTVVGNELTGTTGISMNAGQAATVSDNIMRQMGGDAQEPEIHIIGYEVAIVQDNQVWVTQGPNPAAYTLEGTSAIHVEAGKGKVTGNTVGGFERAASQIDTMITVDESTSVAPGSFYIADNHYAGIGEENVPTGGISPITNGIVVNGGPSTIALNGMCVDDSAATTPYYQMLHQSVISVGGTLTVASDNLRIPFREDAVILFATAMVDSYTSGADILVDVNKNGTTIFTTQANRIKIPDNQRESSHAYPDVTTMAPGDYLTIDVDQVGSTLPGGDLTVLIQWRRGCVEPEEEE